MKTSPRKYAISLYETLLQLKSNEIKDAIKSFVMILAENNSLSKAEQIIDEFEKYWLQKEKIIKVKLTTARILNTTELKNVVKLLKKQLGQEIIVESNVEENLIGGTVIKFNDNLIDGSLKTQLLNLKNNLINK
nr:hypothetical protein [uncultured bacterium]